MLFVWFMLATTRHSSLGSFFVRRHLNLKLANLMASFSFSPQAQLSEAASLPRRRSLAASRVCTPANDSTRCAHSSAFWCVTLVQRVKPDYRCCLFSSKLRPSGGCWREAMLVARSLQLGRSFRLRLALPCARMASRPAALRRVLASVCAVLSLWLALESATCSALKVPT